MPKKIQRVILAWSEGDLRIWRSGDWIVPLTAESHVAAVRTAGSEIVDVNLCLNQPEILAAEARSLVKNLHGALKSSEYPWLEAYANVIFWFKVFQLIVWLRLIRSLHQRYGSQRLEVCSPMDFSTDQPAADGLLYSLAQRSFGLARQILQREGVRFISKKISRSRAESLSRVLPGRAIARGASNLLQLRFMGLPCSANADSMAILPKNVDVVLVTQQYTDAFNAVPLACHLTRRFGERAVCVGMPPRATADMTREEVDLLANANFETLGFVDSTCFLPKSQQNIRRSLLMDFAGAWKVAKIVAADSSFQLSRNDWFQFLMDPALRGFALRYGVWSRALDLLNPKVVIGLSTLQDMALIRAWTRRRGVPFVQFMHGVVPAICSSYHIDADYLGVFGSILADQVKNSGLPQPRSVVACGAMQFGDKLISARKSSSHGDSLPFLNTVLFLGGFESLPFFPWSPTDMWRMLNDVHQVCQNFGKVLRVRVHPRSRGTFWTPHANKLHRQFPESVILSSERSIYRDLEMAGFVVASVFDGATLEALMAQKPVISYLPNGVEQTDYSRPLEQIGGAANGFEELRELFAAIIANSNRAIELRKMQERFLTDYIGDLDGDHWGKAVNLVEEVLKDVKSTSRPELK